MGLRREIMYATAMNAALYEFANCLRLFEVRLWNNAISSELVIALGGARDSPPIGSHASRYSWSLGSLGVSMHSPLSARGACIPLYRPVENFLRHGLSFCCCIVFVHGLPRSGFPPSGMCVSPCFLILDIHLCARPTLPSWWRSAWAGQAIGQRT